MGPLMYNSELNLAYVETHAFKFADDVNVFFKCEITLCSLLPLTGASSLGETTCTGVTVSDFPSGACACFLGFSRQLAMLERLKA